MKRTLVVLSILLANFGFAQRLVAGDLKNLKDINEYNTTFDYTGMVINGFTTEQEFLEDKMSKRSKEGDAQKFKAEWYSNREALYEPAFIEYFNKLFKNGEVKVGKNPEAKYTMDVKTTWIYPGYNAGTDLQPAKISALITVKETANPTKILLVIEFDKSIGLKHDLGNSLGDRIAWAYEKLAKNISMQIKRVL